MKRSKMTIVALFLALRSMVSADAEFDFARAAIAKAGGQP